MKSLRKTRVIIQIFFFAVITLTIFLGASHPVAYKFPADWYQRLNPLIGLLTSVGSRTIIEHVVVWSLITVILTLLMGRVFCGFFCPLGTLIDFSDRYIFGKKKPPKNRRPNPSLQMVKYVFLIAVIILSFFGVFFPLFTDPLSFFTRIVVLIVYPLVYILKIDALHVATPLLQWIGADDLLMGSEKVPLMYGSFGAFALFILVFIGRFWDKRFWCQYVCPTGAFLGLFSRFAIFRRRVNDSCNMCKGGHTCAKVCPTRSIDEKDIKITSAAECVVCGVCTDIKDSCSEFGFGTTKYKETRGADMGRRQVVAGTAASAIALPMFRGNALNKHEQSGRIIRPPGTVPEKMLTARCIGCGECVKVCPMNSIHLTTFEDGANILYTPKIVPRIGGCEEKCYACGHVCPTGAIRKLSYEEKRFVKIGTAVINKDKCLPWEQNKECLVCDECCPYNAITSKVMETPTGKYNCPVVDEDLCLGCGICEEHCPIFDEAAIVVFKFSENRRASGPYITEAKKKQVIEDRRKSDSALNNTLKEVPGGSGGSEGFDFGEEKGVKGSEGFDFGDDDDDDDDEGASEHEGFDFD